MPDNSLVPCKICGHNKNKHSSSYDTCWSCSIAKYNNAGYCRYERLDNLPYLEWIYNQKEKISHGRNT